MEEKVKEIYKILDGLTYSEGLDILDTVRDRLFEDVILEKIDKAWLERKTEG